MENIDTWTVVWIISIYEGYKLIVWTYIYYSSPFITYLLAKLKKKIMKNQYNTDMFITFSTKRRKREKVIKYNIIFYFIKIMKICIFLKYLYINLVISFEFIL
jgi:hypothetical protein